MREAQFDRPICVISPHPDDAALSCANVLALNPGSTVITVCTGAPARPSSVWDLSTTGIEWAPDAMAARRMEDARAMEVLDAQPLWLEVFDNQYLVGPRDRAEMRQALEDALADVQPATVLAPLGFHHNDHISVGDVCLDIAAARDLTIFCYQDRPYDLQWPREAKERLDAVKARVRSVGRPLKITPVDPTTKRFAVLCYGSQEGELRKTFGKNYERNFVKPEICRRVAP